MGDETQKTPQFVLKRAPKFEKNVHDHGWSSDPVYQSTLYKGTYRYPTEL